MPWTGGSRVASTVYEADTTRVGGRCWSLRGYFGNELMAEHGERAAAEVLHQI